MVWEEDRDVGYFRPKLLTLPKDLDKVDLVTDDISVPNRFPPVL